MPTPTTTAEPPRDARHADGARKVLARRDALALVELVVAIVLLAILASIVLTRWGPNVIQQLEAGGAAVAGDVAYVRGLAVAHGVTYEIQWDPASDSYTVVRVNAAGGRTPVAAPPFLTGAGDKSQYIEELQRLPSGPCELIGVETITAPKRSLESVRFDSTGVLDPAQEVRIWLAARQGADRYYLPVVINYPMGTVEVGEIQREAPVLPGSGVGSAQVF